ncbi:MAG: hypothetical protein IKA61_07225 [Clostridia bacterium]|nr:hypothetical protein [Clostridia bacterium]
MRRNFNKLVILVILLCCFVLGGCTDALLSCSEVGQKMQALEDIEAHGDYTFQQGGLYIYKDESFSISSILGNKRAEYGMRKGSQQETLQTSENGDYVYTLYSFGKYTKNDVGYRDVLLSRAPRSRPREVEVVVSLKQVTGREPYFYFLGNYLIFVSNDIYAYEIGAFKEVKHFKIDYFAGDEAFTRNEYFAICQLIGNGQGYNYIILDENLNEYSFQSLRQIRLIDIYKDYFIVSRDEVYNFKTNEQLDAETASLIYDEEEEENQKRLAEKQTFIYKGVKYSWHAEDVDNSESTAESDGDGQYTYYPDLVINNLQTGERHVLTEEEFSRQASEIIDALGTMVYCDQILSENGELYFVFDYTTPDFESGDTPAVFFKYDEQSGELLYIGCSYYYYLTHVYVGKVF